MSTTPDLVAQLREVEAFRDLPDEQLAWFAENSEYIEVGAGGRLFTEGDPADSMMVVLDGESHGRRAQDNRLFVARAGEVTGVLPFSRMQTWGGTGHAATDLRMLRFSRARFPELLREIPDLEARLVAVMTDRVRRFTRDELQQEKLISLGRLAAGLAHELNNPASAAQRSADELRDALSDVRTRTAHLARALDPGSLDRLAGMVETLDGDAAAARDPLARSDHEEEIARWLAEHEVENAWTLASTLASAGADTAWLERIAGSVTAEDLPDTLRWAEATLRADELIAMVREATERISKLIHDVRTYTHVDQAPLQESDINNSIETTLRVLAHKLRDIDVSRDLDPDLPRVRAMVGELNQLWTNLIDNAADAAGPGGHIEIRTAAQVDNVVVDIRDNGRGIPPELQTRVWDPFFTTKDVGQGTGLGLDIARRIAERHGGTITLESVPGDTCFRVRLPLDGRPEEV